MIRKLSSVYVLEHSGFAIVLSYGRLAINFRIVLFTYMRWLFSYGITFLPDARGDMLFNLLCAQRFLALSLSLTFRLSSTRLLINNFCRKLSACMYLPVAVILV